MTLKCSAWDCPQDASYSIIGEDFSIPVCLDHAEKHMHRFELRKK